MSSRPERKSNLRPTVFLWLRRASIARLAFATFLTAAFVAQAGAQQFSFLHYGQDEGLRNLDVFSVVEDNSGMLWLATENGLFRYDGAQFLRYGEEKGIGESLVLGLHKDASGRIWITTNDHLYYSEGDRFTSAPEGAATIQFGAGQTLGSIDARHVLSLARGTLMLLTQTSQARNGHPEWIAAPFFTASEIAGNPALAQIRSAFVSREHDLWLGCGTAICRVRGQAEPDQPQRVEVFQESAGIPAEPWVRFFEDSGGTLWVRGRRHIRVLAPGENAFRPRDLGSREEVAVYRGSGILAIAEDPKGMILTQTNRGLARWEGSSWRFFDSANGIDFKDISAILFDRHGTPWFTTRGHGLVRWQGYGEVENWTIAQGLHDDVVWPIFRDSRHRLWIADQFQVNRLDEASGRSVTPKAFLNLPMAHTTAFAETPDGSLWFFTLEGEALLTDPNAERVVFRQRLPALARALRDSEDRIWVLSRNGLYVIHPQAPSSQAEPGIEKVANPMVSGEAFADAAESPDHDLWFLADNHLYRLSHQNGRFSRIELAPDAVRGQMRNIAASPDGSLWIGGGIAALLHLRVDGDTITTVDSVAPPTLVSSDVQIVRSDRSGWVWVGTDLGVNVFDGHQWRLLTRRDGLISNDTDEGAFYSESDGSVWIGANGGAVHLLHPENLFSRAPLDVRFSSARLGDTPLSLTSDSMVPWRSAPLDIAFTSLNFAREGALHFRYRLSGMEFSWNETTAHSLHYPAVAPGDYRFELQAIDPDQQKQSQTISLLFTVRPPWWRTRAMYLLLGILSFVASILAWHWRERRLLSRQRMLRHLVAQRTKELEAEKAELMVAREALRLQATRDALTGIWNRSAIIEILLREMERSRRDRTPLVIVLADIDHFKRINDTCGHLAGDVILRDAARRMLDNIRPYDYIGRYGGEEFLIVVPGLPVNDPHGRLQQLQQSIAEQPFHVEGHTLQVTSSFGAAWFDRDILDVEDLIRRADTALYQAKAAGRDRILFYEQPR
ncbi:MAG TPA: diguanylate cyclase [Edaphobacter sp.]